MPILLVQHLHPLDDDGFAGHLAGLTGLKVIIANDKQAIEPGCVYVAPANYHMLAERGGSIALSIDERVNWSRPSIDVLFESAALAWEGAVVGVILTGANSDGAKGMRAIKEAGGLTIAQDPASAGTPVMPQAAIDAGAVAEVLGAEDIGLRLAGLGMGEIQ